MAFSILGIFAVALELIRPLLPLLIGLLIIDLILLILALRNGSLLTSAALRLPLVIGAIFAGITFCVAPALTRSSFANLSGMLDYLSLIGGAIGMGLVVALLSWPSFALLQRK